MTLHLYFPLSETLRLAQHAVAAPEHTPTVTEHADGITCPGALEWVHDHGVYLMSSGIPALRDPDNPHANVTVYANGWNPDQDGLRRDPANLGRDHFVEHLHLTHGDPPLIDALLSASAAGHRWLRLTVTRTEYTLAIPRTGPDEV